MTFLTARTMRNIGKTLVATFVTTLVFSINTSPANAFAGTLENGNMAYAQSEFNKGAACNYLPGFETGYDAWHWILTTRGATFQQDPRNPAVAINLNIVYMRQDGSLFVIRSGAWVQTGKGAYTYTPVADRIRLVQAGTLAQINGSDSGMRLSHTCPGSGSITTTPTASPTPTVSPTPTATTTSSPRPTSSPSPTLSPTATPTPSVTPTASPSPSPSLSPTPSPTATPRPTSTVIPTLAPRPSARASAIQVPPTSRPNALPTPSPTPQGITETPTPSPTPTTSGSATPSPATSPTPTGTPRPTASPTASPSPSPTPPALIPPVLPVPPQVEEPKKLIFVEPKTPIVVPPQSLPEPPASPIVITKAPEFGSVTVKPSGEITYTSAITDPKSTTVDVVEITYTSLSGSVVVVRKEFILTQRGDVPSIIQTGYGTTTTSYIFLGVFILIASVVSFRLRGRRDEA